MKKFILIFGLLSFYLSLSFSYAQTGSVTGTVTDNTGEVLPGVNVVVEVQGRSLGASTDADGQYTIENVPEGTRQITAKFIGFRAATQEVQIVSGEMTTIDFELGQTTLNLDEVVVTGTGAAVARKSVGHSIESVDFNNMEDASTNTLDEAMSGKIAGVSIASSGTIDQDPRIRIRGTSSIAMSNEPLFYVDGVRVQSSGGFAPGVAGGGIGAPSALANINFDNIERIEILKGPAAATLYGSQANAGVIQIFTKEGSRETPPQFDIQLSNTFIQMPDLWNPMTGFLETEEQQDRVEQYTGVRHELYEPFEGKYQMDDLYSIGMGQDISTSIRGGGEGFTYNANVRYNHIDGPFNPQPNDFNGGVVGGATDLSKKLYFNGKMNFYPIEDLNFRIQTSYTNANVNTYNTGISIYSVTNSYGHPEDIGSLSQYDTFGAPFASTRRESSFYEISDASDNGNLVLKGNYFLLDEVSLDASFGVDYRNQQSEFLAPFGYSVDGLAPTPSGYLDLGSRKQVTWSFEAKANWTKDLTEDINSNFVVGGQGYSKETDAQFSNGVAFSGPGLEIMDATASQTAGSSFLQEKNVGVFAQEQISYDEWIYVTGGVRLDASSAFGSDFNYATYPKISLSFLPLDAFDKTLSEISTFRLRGAWGQSGQQPGAFDQVTTYLPVSSPDGSGVITGNLGDPTLKPELATEWEVGFELGMFDDQLGINATYWNRSVEDALIDRTFAPSGGFKLPQLTNAAQLNAEGVELSVDANILNQQNFSLNFFANGAYLWEHVESLGGSPPIKVDATYVRDRMFVREGYAPASYFTAKLAPGIEIPIDINQDGVPDSMSELENYFSQPRDPSDFAPSYIMVAGPDDNPTVGGQGYRNHYAGKPTPDWEGSFGFSARFLKNFNLSTRFKYAAGNYYHHNLTIAFRRSNAGIGRNYMPASRLASILKDPETTTEDRVQAAKNWATEMVGLSPFDGLNEVQKADYIRWSNLSISYQVPETFLTKFGLRNASITASGNNLALWTGYGGVDPTATSEGSTGGDGGLYENFAQGMEIYSTPLLRTYAITLDIGF